MPSTIEHAARPDRAVRRTQPTLTVELQAQAVSAADWSETGFLLRGWGEPAQIGQAIEGTAQLGGKSGRFGARVVRADAALQVLAVAFTEVDPDLRDEMVRLG
jgi:hypothetical protein